MNKSVVIVLALLLQVMASCNVLKKKPNRKNVTVDSSGVVTTVTDTTAPLAVLEDTVVAPVDVPTPGEVIPLSPEKQALINTLMPMWAKRIDYKTFKGKAKMHYEGMGMKHDLAANFRMEKDKVIWVHVTAGMGLVNVARVYITPDSLTLLNYLDKSVMRMTAEEARQKLPASIDFNLIQSLIMGEGLRNTGQPVDASDFGGTWSLDIAGADAKQQANFNKADSTLRSLQVLSTLAGGLAGMIQFGNYSNVTGRNFALSRAINVQSKGEQHYLDMTFNNASFDEAVDFPFSIPADYVNK